MGQRIYKTLTSSHLFGYLLYFCVFCPIFTLKVYVQMKILSSYLPSLSVTSDLCEYHFSSPLLAGFERFPYFLQEWLLDVENKTSWEKDYFFVLFYGSGCLGSTH